MLGIVFSNHVPSGAVANRGLVLESHGPFHLLPTDDHIGVSGDATGWVVRLFAVLADRRFAAESVQPPRQETDRAGAGGSLRLRLAPTVSAPQQRGSLHRVQKL